MENINGFQNYLREIKSVPLLTAKEEISLAKKYAAGDKRAKERLIISNLRLVVMAAKQYSMHTSLSFDDLVQEGNIGLITAVDGFDPDRGYRFSTYAMYWIKQAISRAILKNSRTIRIPIHMLELKSKYGKAQTELRNSLGRDPKSEEIAKFLGITIKKVKEVETLIKEPISLNTSLNDEDDGTVEDLVADPNAAKPEDRVDNELRASAIKAALVTLDAREQDIIISRYGLNHKEPQTLEQLGNKYGLTKERIRQIEQKALYKLRNPMRAEALKKHLN